MHLCYIGTAGNHFPGVPKVWGVHLQLVVATHHVVVDIAIKVTTQTAHPALHNETACEKNQGRKISKWLKRCVNKGAWTDPVRGWDVNQQTSPLVPADGDVLSQQQSVKLARAYNLHLRALQHRLLHFHLHERQKDDDERGSKTSEFFCWIIKK